MKKSDNITEYLGKLEFDDFPKECYLKTYLGSRVLIIGRDSGDLICIWLENGTFVKDFYVGDLQASKEEITEAYEILCSKIGKKKTKSSKSFTDIIAEYGAPLLRPNELRPPQLLQQPVPVWEVYAGDVDLPDRPQTAREEALNEYN